MAGTASASTRAATLCLSRRTALLPVPLQVWHGAALRRHLADRGVAAPLSRPGKLSLCPCHQRSPGSCSLCLRKLPCAAFARRTGVAADLVLATFLTCAKAPRSLLLRRLPESGLRKQTAAARCWSPARASCGCVGRARSNAGRPVKWQACRGPPCSHCVPWGRATSAAQIRALLCRAAASVEMPRWAPPPAAQTRSRGRRRFFQGTRPLRLRNARAACTSVPSACGYAGRVA